MFATIHDYESASEGLARITASLTEENANPREVRAALQAALPEGVTPVRDSFRWVDDSRRNSVVGFVYQATPMRTYDEKADAGKYKQVAANMVIDPSDESLWTVKSGSGGKYLARSGQVDLTAMLETARVAPTGSAPRMYQVVKASAAPNEMVAFVCEGRNTAEVDVGAVLQRADGGLRVLSSFSRSPITVPESHVVQAFSVHRESTPKIPRETASRIIAARKGAPAGRETAADRMGPLTPEEYWKLAYDFADGSGDAYIEKVLKQVQEMAVA